MYDMRCRCGVLRKQSASNDVSCLFQVTFEPEEVRKCVSCLYDQKGNVLVHDSDIRSSKERQRPLCGKLEPPRVTIPVEGMWKSLPGGTQGCPLWESVFLVVRIG